LHLLASEGRVVIRVLVRGDGTVGTVLVNQSSGNPALDRAAVEAAAFWRFQPATRDGVAIDAWAVIPVRFVLH
jgi:protein TonB